MKLGIDISQIVYEGTGVARFTRGLLEAILDYDVQNEWIVFFSGRKKKLDPQLEKKIQSKGYHLVKWSLPPTLLAFFCNDLRTISKIFYSHFPAGLADSSTLNSLDWFITSDWTEPPLRCKKATIVHDLAYKRYPETVHATIAAIQEKRLQLVKKESQVIFADSHATKHDLKKLLNIPEEKIRVIYPGIAINTIDEEFVQGVLKKFAIARPFLFTVGKIEPRKNLPRLMSAFQSLNQNKVELIIAGPSGWGVDKAPQGKNIRFLGYVSDRELSCLYQSCLGFIYPSLWEGFGFPVLEDMAHGAPVATSAVSSLEEIAKGAALLFNPHSTKEITHALSTLIKKQELRKKLIEKGQERSKQFCWKTYYNEFIHALQTA